MLVRFSCKNFRSIGGRQIDLDMVSSCKIKMHPTHVWGPTEGAHLLRNAAIYGGNASGKSNIVRAIAFMRSSVLGGALPPGTLREYCRAREGLKDQESTFEMQLETDGVVYDYGFSCVLSAYRVTSEWLYELGEDGQPLFERGGDGAVSFGDSVEGSATEEDLTRLRVYAGDFARQAGDRPASLFLSSVGMGKVFDGGSPLAAFERVSRWFLNGIRVLGAGNTLPSSDFYLDGKTLNEVAQILSSFDTGVSSLRKREIPFDELDRHVSHGLALAIRRLLADPPAGPQGDLLALTARDGDSFVGIERETGADEPRATLLEVRHHGSRSEFEFGEESDGTQRLFDFMDMLLSSNRNATFVVDEIDRSFHPMLTQQLVRLFNDAHADDGCQLVCTTHESRILSYDYFRKDEIWFVDRGEDGTSSLYSLDEFVEARTDSRISKQYLEGRYGGVPALAYEEALLALRGEED